MELNLVIVGIVLVILGVARHFMGNVLPRGRFQLVVLPGRAVAGIGASLAIVGILI
jgi:hypothetical protein